MSQNHKIKLVKGDITKLKVDAIVNAANSKLMGGGGVDGAIHQGAGPNLPVACSKLNGCKTGDAKITSGFDLQANFIIHTVGPIWRGGNSNEEKLLESCYRNSLLIAESNNIRTIAFPNISTGIYGYPKNMAAKVAIDTVQDILLNNNSIQEVIFVCFDKDNLKLYQDILYP